MKVILLDNIKGVGKKDEVINASDGYARNFLFPKKLAVEANAENMAKLKGKQDSASHKKAVEKDEAKQIAEKLKTICPKLKIKTGENGKILGSKAIYEGEAIVNILYESVETRQIDKKEFRFPINYEINILEGMKEENLDIIVDVEKCDILAENENVGLNIGLNINTKMFKTIELNIIDELEEKELEEKVCAAYYESQIGK